MRRGGPNQKKHYDKATVYLLVLLEGVAYIASDAGAIMLRYVYGWFERESWGVYRLTKTGKAALQQWPPRPDMYQLLTDDWKPGT